MEYHHEIMEYLFTHQTGPIWSEFLLEVSFNFESFEFYIQLNRGFVKSWGNNAIQEIRSFCAAFTEDQDFILKQLEIEQDKHVYQMLAAQVTDLKRRIEIATTSNNELARYVVIRRDFPELVLKQISIKEINSKVITKIIYCTRSKNLLIRLRLTADPELQALIMSRLDELT